MWLQLHMHQIVGVDLNTRLFPLSNHPEGEPQATRGCQNYGEAASTVLIQQDISQLFELFFKGFQNPLWLPYLDNDTLIFPCDFSFESERQDGRFLEILNITIRPCMLPAEFNGGRLNSSTYEYYQPNVMARQLGCGQMPQDCSCTNSSSPERKSKNSCTVAESSITCAVPLSTPGLLCPQP
jgi:hypothetical protein